MTDGTVYLEDIGLIAGSVHEITQPTLRIIPTEYEASIRFYKCQCRPLFVTCRVEVLSGLSLVRTVLVEQLDVSANFATSSGHYFEEELGVDEIWRENLRSTKYKLFLQIINNIFLNRLKVVFQQGLLDSLEWLVDKP